MKPRFKPDAEHDPAPTEDSDYLQAFDASEQMFAASLEVPPVRPVFTVSRDESQNERDHDAGPPKDTEGNAIHDLEIIPPKQSVSNTDAVLTSPGAPPLEDAVAWKQEVTARVSRYRSRRPRVTRYPSLLLKFESAMQDPVAIEFQPAVSLEAVATELAPLQPGREGEVLETTGRLLEFPRGAVAPPRPIEELADPVPALPRILDIPDAPSPPPALGGILMDAAVVEDGIRRPGFEIPLHGASLARRILASVLDLAIVLFALAGFAYIFLRVAHQIPTIVQASAMGAMIGGMLWAAYQYAFLVYAGSTPGLALTRMRLSCFDGKSVPRKTRSWRALAAVLSAVSLGLGYLWCFLDEDQLCWHDRITATYMAPNAPNAQNH
jgi:uncharacterized RDD family membrane protein YckC